MPVVAETGGGIVVCVGSGSAQQPTPFLSVYAATKAFVQQLSRSLDREWRGRGVRVLCAAPYYVSGTGLFNKAQASFNAPAPAVVVDGTLATLCLPSKRGVELTHTCLAHSIIAFLFTTIAEDPVLGALARPLARALRVNGSMLLVMTKARSRFLSKKGAGK